MVPVFTDKENKNNRAKPRQMQTGTPSRNGNGPSTELAKDDCNDQKHQYGDDGDGNYSICGHPDTTTVSAITAHDHRSQITSKAYIRSSIPYLRAMPLKVLTLLST